MTIDLFATRTMLDLLEQLYPAPQFLLDTFFKRESKSNTEYVDIDIVKGNKKLAAFVRPIDKGSLVDPLGYTTKSFKPPYVKPKMKTDAERFLRRRPGETIYQGSSSPSLRASQELAKDMIYMQELIMRREEAMAAELLQTGKVTVVGDGVNAEIDFGMPAGHLTTASTLWGASGADPIENLRTWCRLVQRASGINPNICVMGSTAAGEFIDDAKVQTLLDLRRVDVGEIKPAELPDGSSYVGRINLPDLNLDIYCYSEQYTDSEGSATNFLAASKIILGSTRARCERHYGAIRDLEFSDALPVRWFPKTWIEPDPSQRLVMLQSSPLPCMHQPDAFLCATVTA